MTEPNPTEAALLAAHEAQARESKQDARPLPSVNVTAATLKSWSNHRILANLDRCVEGTPLTVRDLAPGALPVGRLVNLGLASPAQAQEIKDKKRKARPRKQTEAAKRYKRATREFRSVGGGK